MIHLIVHSSMERQSILGGWVCRTNSFNRRFESVSFDSRSLSWLSHWAIAASILYSSASRQKLGQGLGFLIVHCEIATDRDHSNCQRRFRQDSLVIFFERPDGPEDTPAILGNILLDGSDFQVIPERDYPSTLVALLWWSSSSLNRRGG